MLVSKDEADHPLLGLFTSLHNYHSVSFARRFSLFVESRHASESL